MPPYIVKELQTQSQMDEVVDVIWKAQFKPYMPSTSIFWPILGPFASDRLNAIQCTKDRLWKEYCATDKETYHWMVVEDENTKKIVAGCQWAWHEKSKFTNGVPKLDMYWWPDVEAKAFSECMMEQAMTPRCLWMHEKHAGLSMMVVHPDHRNRGVGGLMMEWAQTRMDEMKIEGFIEASPLGRQLYEKWGYQVVMKLDFFVPPDKGDEWNRLAHNMMMPAWYAMWRSPMGVVEPGQRNRPWQLLPQLLP